VRESQIAGPGTMLLFSIECENRKSQAWHHAAVLN